MYLWGPELDHNFGNLAIFMMFVASVKASRLLTLNSARPCFGTPFRRAAPNPGTVPRHFRGQRPLVAALRACAEDPPLPPGKSGGRCLLGAGNGQRPLPAAAACGSPGHRGTEQGYGEGGRQQHLSLLGSGGGKAQVQAGTWA